ncbi:TetR/AcrR family transcriptional regulator [Tsukamurella paurometabola]|uniref:TetR/AcrR family transcriptional regulator n=1 Tax=Tsukamurella paurometabola TaxID=2061 RepID=UPI00019F093C|nr:TetR/AcrR family transcriptional regulator [Tsukamurella paurometabola]
MLEATIAQLGERGLDGLSIAEVASHAGVAETTVYRRWPTRTALVADAVSDLAASGNPAPDLGDVRTDLTRVAEQIAGLLSMPGIPGLIGTVLAMAADPHVAASRQEFFDARIGMIAPVVRRAIARGELDSGVDERDVIETLAAPLYFCVVVGGELDDAAVRRSVDRCLRVHASP